MSSGENVSAPTAAGRLTHGMEQVGVLQKMQKSDGAPKSAAPNLHARHQ